MILEGNQRGGAKNLALHLLKDENDKVELHELRGFVADDLVGALNESYAVSRGTRAKKFLFSLSCNPPPEENVPDEVFYDAISRSEKKLGLENQPRAIVFHEKTGVSGDTRRHCHVVWSRIDAEAMKAIPLSHTKRKLMDVSLGLYRDYGWQMPMGFVRKSERDPNNFTLKEWQQAKRFGKNPAVIKQTIRECWAASDSQASFQAILKERGYELALGRKTFMAIDQHCAAYAITRWGGLKTKVVRARLDHPELLDSVGGVKDRVAKETSEKIAFAYERSQVRIKERMDEISSMRRQIAGERIKRRVDLLRRQEDRLGIEERERQKRFQQGWRGFLDRVTGRRRKIERENSVAEEKAKTRDLIEQKTVASQKLELGKRLGAREERLKRLRESQQEALTADLDKYRSTKMGEQEADQAKHVTKATLQP